MAQVLQTGAAAWNMGLTSTALVQHLYQQPKAMLPLSCMPL